MAAVQFACQAYQSHALQLDAQQCINMYVEKSPKDAKSQVPVFGSAGLNNFATCFAGPGAVYDIRVVTGQTYAVTSHGLYLIVGAGSADLLAGFTPAGRTGVANNDTQIEIVDGTNTWCYDIPSATLNTLTGGANVYPANTVAYFDDYFLLDRAGTNFVDYSALSDGTSFDGLDFFSADADPDIVLGVSAVHEQLLIIGSKTIEFWWDAGALNQPFQRIQSTLLQRGMAAPLAFVQEDNTLFWLGNDGIFYRLQNFFPLRVSQHAMEAAWQTYSTMTDVFCFSYTQEGHKFIVLTFPSAPATWVLDLSTMLWHQRESWDANDTSYGRWRGNCACYSFDQILIGDAYTGQIGIADFNVFTEYGNTMRGLITSPPIQEDRRRIFLKRFELDVTSGVGLTSGQGENPIVVLDWSDDGGVTWNTQQVLLYMGRKGEYTKRLYRRRLGQSRSRVLRLQTTDPVRRNFIGFYSDAQAGIG